MLPRMLAIASLRQTSRLRRHTGRKRSENDGNRNGSDASMQFRSVAAFAVDELRERLAASRAGKVVEELRGHDLRSRHGGDVGRDDQPWVTPQRTVRRKRLASVNVERGAGQP